MAIPLTEERGRVLGLKVLSDLYRGKRISVNEETHEVYVWAVWSDGTEDWGFPMRAAYEFNGNFLRWLQRRVGWDISEEV